MLALLIVESAAVALLAVLVIGLLRSHAEILRRLHDLDDGLEAAPARPAAMAPRIGDGPAGGRGHDLTGETLDGEAVEIGLVGAPEPTLLAFLSGTCYTCEPFWSALSAGVDVPGGARVIVVVQEGDSIASLRRHAGPDLLVVRSDQAWADYDVPGSPHFAYVDGPSGQVTGEGTASTWPQIRDLLEQATGAGEGPAPIDLVRGARDNVERIDHELLAAGIGPGHPSLYPGGPSAEPTAG